VRILREDLSELPDEARYRVINLLDVQITLDYTKLDMGSIRLWVLDHPRHSGTTTACSGGHKANPIVTFRARLFLAP